MPSHQTLDPAATTNAGKARPRPNRRREGGVHHHAPTRRPRIPCAAMPPADRVVPRFAAEPPQDLLPYGRWADRLEQEFLSAALIVDTEGEQLGEPGEITW